MNVPQTPLPGLLYALKQHRLVGERPEQTARRLLLMEALEKTDLQAEAAEILGWTKRIVCYWVKKYGWKEKP